MLNMNSNAIKLFQNFHPQAVMFVTNLSKSCGGVFLFSDISLNNCLKKFYADISFGIFLYVNYERVYVGRHLVQSVV